MVSVNFFLKLYYNWWKNIDKKILFLILLLFGLSLFFSLSSTSLIASEKLNTEDYYFFFKHLIFVLLGFIIIFIFSSLEKFYLIKISKILFILSLILLTIVPFIGVEVKGSKRWLDFLFLPRFQPVEILKPFFIVMIVSILASESSKNIYLKYSFSFFLVLIIIFLLISQPDVGQSLLIFLTWFSIIFVSGINLYIFSFLILLMFTSLGIILIFFPKYQYIVLRLKTFFDSSAGNSYQSDKASEAISSGGFFGKGIGEGVLKNTVPEVHTD
jgi:Bacterial cell division membrane protein